MPTDEGRMQAMARAYVEEGLTYAQIADRYGISRQRVGQLLGPLALAKGQVSARRTSREQALRRAHRRIMAGEVTLELAAAELGYKNGHALRGVLYDLGLRVNVQSYAEPPHGTYARYQSHRFACRCDECRRANREYHAQMAGREPREHGTASGYLNYACRCQPCKEAMRVHLRSRRAQRRQGRSKL